MSQRQLEFCIAIASNKPNYQTAEVVSINAIHFQMNMKNSPVSGRK